MLHSISRLEHCLYLFWIALILNVGLVIFFPELGISPLFVNISDFFEFHYLGYFIIYECQFRQDL